MQFLGFLYFIVILNKTVSVEHRINTDGEQNSFFSFAFHGN